LTSTSQCQVRMSNLNTALVTGGGCGIGKETAIMLSKNGLNVIICSRTKKEIESTVKEVVKVRISHKI
jgi:short-subunit dehydrogenase involved in D-alanine esterification of teichoic acids